MKLEHDHGFSVFYEKYKDSIYKVIRFISMNSEDVDDIAQEVFLNIYRSFPKYSQERGSFYTWAAAIAKNTYYTYRKNRMKERERIFEGETGFETFSAKDDFIETLENKVVEQELREAIETLPEPEKSIILLKEIDNYTLEKTSQVLNISSRTVSRKLLKALDLLREELERRKVIL
ncbi:sigma-70 family RNA polymerase sigma factor [Leptospira gomenensis]|uniref:Sigma-70 family RNA polymerase sigma factor n=1 Tax=Leptospira gomenensis TaxID=2484974 RepID=A0A5F1YGH6_9LEPT|nr:sigma-70 family RNA polymerase sigma factor [Leptospira gomenensis]TGK39238.1 sigma-70 family RNA polymerase sigma factor [Leptospira gomenensis]TGK42548.1 sigma-70 family RNA polymerase sigma factor [Leptospira gomenensis]TGK48908.1 sigma-70 family RNA polymerase sigma factor [Leptospira gomenensis]TGK54618.1 sigma-70 family RNA polymerase sigma factor [Leptospira gomenensis]